jgi:hypothetical protein
VRVDNSGRRSHRSERVFVDGSWFDPDGAAAMHCRSARSQPAIPRTATTAISDTTRRCRDCARVYTRRISRDQFDYNGNDGASEQNGTADTVELGVTEVLARSRTRSVSLDFGANYQKLQLDTDGAPGSLSDQSLWFVAGGRVRGPRVRSAAHFDERPDPAIECGRFESGREPGQSSPFYRLRMDGSAWRLMSLPGFASTQTLRLVISGQLASTAMPGTLQMGLGGPGRVQAYDRSTASVDDGIYVGLDFRMAPEAGRVGDFLLFADGAYGEIKREFADDVSVGLASVGAGWDLPLGTWLGASRRHQLDAQLRFSVPVADKGSQDWINDDGVTLYWIAPLCPISLLARCRLTALLLCVFGAPPAWSADPPTPEAAAERTRPRGAIRTRHRRGRRPRARPRRLHGDRAVHGRGDRRAPAERPGLGLSPKLLNGRVEGESGGFGPANPDMRGRQWKQLLTTGCRAGSSRVIAHSVGSIVVAIGTMASDSSSR